MTPKEVDFIKQTIEIEGKEFGYYKDQYALDLLSIYTKQGRNVNTIRNSQFGHLLQKPIVKGLMSQKGTARLDEKFFSSRFPEAKKYFNYTIGTWGEYRKHGNDPWYQTSRSGLNLVLQLNFDLAHNTTYFQYMKPNKNDHPFVYDYHPVKIGGGFTMAWARIYVDLENGEALIEEIQTDWLREVKDEVEDVRREIKKDKDRVAWWGNGSLQNFLIYYEEFLAEYFKFWDEATLDASLMFLFKELGCRKLYYHTFETGCLLKGLASASKRPPRSLYTKLPKKFGFRETDEAPQLLKKEKQLKRRLRDRSLRWYEMNF